MNGGLEGPVRGLYPRLADQLVKDGIASLRMDYRYANQLYDCVLDYNTYEEIPSCVYLK